MGNFNGTPDFASAGDTITIHIHVPNQTGATTIAISNGSGQSQNVSVTLNSDGNGTVDWTFPDSGWDHAYLTHEGCQQWVVTRDDD